MSGFLTVGAVNDAGRNGVIQRMPFYKSLPSTTVARVSHTTWLSTGSPDVGTNPTTGPTNGRVCTRTTAGALNFGFGNATSPANNYLLAFGAQSSSTGTLVLCDRVADVNLSIAAVASTAITGCTATSRLDGANQSAPPYRESCLMITEVTTALSAAANTITLLYTNQDGTGSRTATITTVASAVAGRTCEVNPFVTLQAGDVGARSIDNVTITGTATGNINIALVRPLAWLPLQTANVWCERDYSTEILNMDRLFDNTCLMMLWIPTAAATATFAGEIRTVEG